MAKARSAPIAIRPVFRAITLDPGGTTGIVLADKQEDVLNLYPFQLKLTPLELLRFLESEDKYTENIIYEEFRFRGRATPDGVRLTPAHLIGIILAYAEAKKRRIYPQEPMNALGGHFKTRESLERYGVWHPNLVHGMDAMRHFMYWYTFGSGFQYNNKCKIRLDK